MPDEDATTSEDRLSEVRSRLDAFFREAFKPYIHHLSQNMNRAAGLVFFASKLRDRNATTAQDMLRAVVVLNHAYLEDLLRTFASELLPEANETALDEIPLAGVSSSGRAEKFFLGKLARHKGKLVDEVLRESVSEYLERFTFNSVSDIAQLLTTLGFKVTEHNEEFPQLEKMMQRRHQIVHRADRVKGAEPETYALQPIEPSEVEAWLQATANFMASLMQSRSRKLYPPEKIAEMFNIRIVQE
jgi:hypothetical protein